MSNQHAKFYHIYPFYIPGNGMKIKIDENAIQLFLKVQQVINIFFSTIVCSFLFNSFFIQVN